MASNLIIADKHGHIMRPQAAHQGASWSLPDMLNWLPYSASADADILPEVDTLIGRSRDLEQNNGVAAGISQTLVDHVIGPRLRLSSTPNWRALGRDKRWSKEWSAAVEARWRTYSTSPAQFDVQRQSNLTQMAALVLRGRVGNGGHCVIPYYLPDRGWSRYGTAFLSIEIDRLSNPQNRPDADRLRGGIEFDRYGAPVAYHVRNRHPGEYGGWRGDAFTWETIPAMTEWGRPRFLHCFHKTRAGQSRAAPALASVLRDFKALSRYQQAELNSAVSGALMTLFIETQMDATAIASQFTTPTEYIDKRKEVNDAGVKPAWSRAVMDSNMIVPLFPGDKIHNPKNPHPNSEFGRFIEQILRYIGAALGVSYETLMRDFSRTNYSSARAAMLMDWKTFQGLFEWLVTCFAKPAYEMWLEEAVAAGDIDAPNFAENRAAYSDCFFTGAGRGYIDPSKEAQASVTKLKYGLTTLQADIAEQGFDVEEIQHQRAVEIRNAFDLVSEFKLPEAAAYALAGLDPPKSDTLTTPPGPNSGLVEDDREDAPEQQAT